MIQYLSLQSHARVLFDNTRRLARCSRRPTSKRRLLLRCWTSFLLSWTPIIVPTAAAFPEPRSPKSEARPGDAVVTIKAEGVDRDQFGSGFYYTPDGLLATCYHVIRGASQITVYDALGHVRSQDEQVRVVAIAPALDLALLRVAGRSKRPAMLTLHPRPSDITPYARLETLGHPSGMKLQHLFGRATQSGYAKSGEVFDIRSKLIFMQKDVDLLLLDITAGVGMSGGPVLWKGKVIGILSGGLGPSEPVRAIQWAVPVSYLVSYVDDRRFQRIEKLPGSVASWPENELMEKGFRAFVQVKARPIPAESAVVLSGMVRDGSDSPLPLVNVVVLQDRMVMQTAFTDGAGRFQIQVRRGEPAQLVFMSQGRATIAWNGISTQNNQTLNVDLGPGANAEVREGSARIEGTIHSRNGQPWDNVVVTAVCDGLFLRSTRSLGNGSYSIELPRGGNVVLQFSREELGILSLPGVYRGGSQRIDVVLP